MQIETLIYLDNAATTPVDKRVTALMQDVLVSETAFGNPSSANHAYGLAAEELIQVARQQVAGLVNADPQGLVWVSGATEADSLGVMGTARFREMQGRHLITSKTEHSAVLGACRQLEQEGFKVTYLEPDRQGVVTSEQVKEAMTDDTVLVSLMHANNETGVITDIAAIGELCRSCDVLFHVDAAQSAGRLLIDMQAQKIDLLSLSAHKLYGPKGIGALCMNTERVSRLQPLMYGGGQEQGLRPGTLPTHQIAAMGEACRIAAEQLDADAALVEGLRERLWLAIADTSGLIRNCPDVPTLSSILSVTVEGVEGESLMFELTQRGLGVANGSACNTASDDASYVMRALGYDDQLSQSTIRFSIGRFNTGDEIAEAAERFKLAVTDLRSRAARLSEFS